MPPPSPRSGAGIAVVVDTDAGIDDAVALAVAARAAELDVVAVTTSYGNAPLALTTRNARHVLALAGRADIPVFPGADRPLTRRAASAPTMHGPTGVGEAPVPPPTDVTTNPLALLEVLRTLHRPATLITLGPLTNLARALERDAALVTARVHRHLGMFGSLAVRATPQRLADFNAWSDPEAAARVVAARLPSTMVPLDVTRRCALGPAEVARLAHSRQPLAAWLGAALQFYLDAQRRALGTANCTVHDLVPLGELLLPGLLACATHRICVDLDDGERRGHTRERHDGTAIRVAQALDTQRLKLLLERVRAWQ